MYEAIDAAKESVYLEMYIFLNDIQEFNFYNLLIKKAEEGLKVCLILDSFGSLHLGKNSTHKLQSAGVEVLFMSSLLHRLHRKILIIDEEKAFLGGVNLNAGARTWNDLSFMLKGKIVKRIVRVFAQDYAYTGGKYDALLSKNKKFIFHKTRTWLVEHSPLTKVFGMKNAYKEHINTATSTLTLVTPYFVPKRFLISLLHQAVLKGVDVNVLVPVHVENNFITKTNYFYMNRISKMGVNFYLQPEMNHAKIMIVDGREALVGSQNLDFLSFDFNSEIGVFFKDANSVGKLSSIVAKWKADSVPFDHSLYKLRFWEVPIAYILHFFVKIL